MSRTEKGAPIQSEAPPKTDNADETRDDSPPGAVPEIIRRMAALGLSGFFSTESAIRRALGDTMPQDWVDFASEQSERTRNEVIDRMAEELGRSISSINLAELAGQLLEGRTIEINAQIRLSDRDEGAQATAGSKIRSKVKIETD